MQEHALHILVQYSALMMCRIYRGTETTSWKVEAIGDKLEEGYASRYEPVRDYCKQTAGRVGNDVKDAIYVSGICLRESVMSGVGDQFC